MATDKIFFKYRIDNKNIGIKSAGDPAEFLRELKECLEIDMADMIEQFIAEQPQGLQALIMDVSDDAKTALQLLEELQENETALKAFIDEIQTTPIICARRVVNVAKGVIWGVKRNKDINGHDTKQARFNMALPKAEHIKRICNNMTWWSLEDVPAFYGLIVARAICAYYETYKTKDNTCVIFDALKIGELIRGKKPQGEQLKTIERVIAELETKGGLPIMQTSGRINKGVTVKAWEYKDEHFLLADFYATKVNKVGAYWEVDTDYMRKREEREKRLKTEKERAVDEMQKQFTSFTPSTELVKVEKDILKVDISTLCKTPAQICAFYYIAEYISTARAEQNKVIEIKIQDLYSVCGLRGKSATRFYSKFVIDKLVNELKNITEQIETKAGAHNENKFLYVTLQ